MQSQPRPVAAKAIMSAEHARRDAQVQAWIKRREGATNPLPALDEETLSGLVMLQAQNEVGANHGLERHARRALEQTLPAARAPKWTDHAEDLFHVWSQPEMTALWAEWDVPRPPGTPAPPPTPRAPRRR